MIDMLMGLTNYSLPDFVKLFNFLLQWAQPKDLDTGTHEWNTLEQVKTILRKAVDAIGSLCSANKWHISI